MTAAAPGDGDTHPAASADLRGGIWSAGFLGLLLAQLLGAANDNIFRWLVIGIGKQYAPAHIHLILMAGTASFVLPYLLLAAPAGYLADRYSKRSVLVGCKAAEIFIMALGVLAIFGGQMTLLLVVVALMGAQSALFGPAKLGSIPELLKAEHISIANGLVALTTMVATVAGTAVGNVLSDLTMPNGTSHLWLTASVLLGVAAVGWLTSLLIARLPAAAPERTFPWDAAGQTWRDLRLLASSRPLFRVALGTMFFWSLGALAQLNVDQFAAEGGTRYQAQNVPLLLSLVFGVAAGSILAGVWSHGRVELGILPLGAAGVVLSAFLLFQVEGSLVRADSSWTAGFVWACAFLFFLGTSAGLFEVPLAAYMQHRSPPQSLGSILAATNFLTFGGVIAVSLLYAGLRAPLVEAGPGLPLRPLCSARQVFLLCGLVTIPVFLYIVFLIPQAVIRFAVWMLSRTCYRIRVVGREHLPERGGALLVANHVSWLDGVLLLLTSSRPVRMIVYAGNFKNRILLWMAGLYGAILIQAGPKSIVRALKTARQALIDGELVCIFPEGGITRSGQLQGFRPGLMKILEGADVPVIPVFLDELWGSIFSFQGGKFFWKWPRRWPYPISIHFGPPVKDPADVHQVRQAVSALGSRAVRRRVDRMTFLPQAFIRQCKRRKFRSKAADSTGADLTGGQLLMRSLILRRLLNKHVLGPDEKYVAVLLPPSTGAVVTNMALALMRRVVVNLNYTVTSAVLNHCLAECGIKHVLTSRKVMEKMQFDLKAEIVYLEDLAPQVTGADKLTSALAAYAVPAGCLEWALGLRGIKADDLLTVVFTSGSTGMPKGVMLSHANIGTNAGAIDQVVHLRPSDTLIGILPFFHSFGYTVTLWGAMSLDIKGAYHFSPLDARQIGKLCRQHRATILLATPTFLRSYLRRCEPEDLATLDVVVVGAEKLPTDLAAAFEEKFKVRPVEGYGATELSPLVSVNVPPSRSLDNFQVDRKEGTVGRPLAGITARIVGLESGQELGVDEPGMLQVTGPNVMQGYLNQPEKTAEVIHDGWYVTGDVARIDADGFITITGRESRFSKIGGEMVPHVQIEETLARILGETEDGSIKAAVTAVPHATKGERLVVVHAPLEKSPDEICKALSAAGLPNLFIPGTDSFLEVPELPVLGSGKLDLKAVKQLALERFGESK